MIEGERERKIRNCCLLCLSTSTVFIAKLPVTQLKLQKVNLLARYEHFTNFGLDCKSYFSFSLILEDN